MSFISISTASLAVNYAHPFKICMNNSVSMKMTQSARYSLRLCWEVSPIPMANTKTRTIPNRSALAFLVRYWTKFPFSIQFEISAGSPLYSMNPRHCSTLRCLRFVQSLNSLAMECNYDPYELRNLCKDETRWNEYHTSLSPP